MAAIVATQPKASASLQRMEDEDAPRPKTHMVKHTGRAGVRARGNSVWRQRRALQMRRSGRERCTWTCHAERY